MKRTTYLVTIEDDKAHTAEDVRNALDLYAGIDPECLTVTDITATHAKEREVLTAALAQLEACERNNRWIDSTTATEDKARELRALMEGNR